MSVEMREPLNEQDGDYTAPSGSTSSRPSLPPRRPPPTRASIRSEHGSVPPVPGAPPNVPPQAVADDEDVVDARLAQIQPTDKPVVPGLPQAEDNVDDLLHRNYPLIFFCATVGFGIGFMVFLFTGFDDYCWILTFVGVVMGFTIDYFLHNKINQQNKPFDIPDWAVAMTETPDMKPPIGARFYIQSDFQAKTLWLNHKFYVGSTSVAVIDDMLTVRQKFVARAELYRGFEIGFTIGFVLAFILVMIFVTLPQTLGKTPSRYILTILLTIAVSLLGGFICGLFERFCRQRNLFFSPPMISVERRTTVGLDEIAHIQWRRETWNDIRDRRRQSLVCEEKIGLWLFRILLLPFLIVYYSIKFILRLLDFNPLFVIWVFVFIAAAFQYDVHITKTTNSLESAVSMTWITFVLALVPIYWFGSKDISVGEKTFPRLSRQRLDESDRVKCWGIGICLAFLLFLSAALVTAVQYDVAGSPSTKVDLPKQGNYTQYELMVCKPQRNKNIRRLITNLPRYPTKPKPKLCNTRPLGTMSSALFFVSLTFLISLIAAYRFHVLDLLSQERFYPSLTRDWVTYTGVLFMGVPRISFFDQFMFTKWLSAWFWGHPTLPIYVSLKNEHAEELRQYLALHCKLFNWDGKE